MQSRRATREEILKEYAGRRVSFGTYIREVGDSRAENGVRHISKARALCTEVEGVPMVTRKGEHVELFAEVFTLENGREFVALPTVVRPEHRTN